MGITQCTSVLADGKKTIETLQSTKNQTKTARLLRLSFEQVHGVMLRAVERGLEKRDKNRIYKHVCMDEKSIRRGHEYVIMLLTRFENVKSRSSMSYVTPSIYG